MFYRYVIGFLVLTILGAEGRAQTDAVERFLLPIHLTAATSGAFGSSWVSELRVLNTGSNMASIENLGVIGTDNAGFSTVLLPPGEVVGGGQLFINGLAGSTPGALLNVPSDFARDLDFQLRVRDTSRAAQGWGTWIPVISESQMVAGPLHLFDLPTHHAYRLMLRVYALSPGGGSVRVRVDALRGHPSSSVGPEVVIAQFSAPLRIGQQNSPSYAEITDFGNSHELARYLQFRVTVEPEGDFPIWAMVSITNNITQEVTMVLPSRR